MLGLHRRPTASRGVPAPRTHERAELLALMLALVAAVTFYAGAFWVRGFRIPVGDDSFFYVSAIRIAGRLGLATSHLASRPAYPLVGATLASVVRSSPWTTAVALPFVMAAGTAAAGAAMAARWGVRRWALAAFLFAACTSVVVGRLVAGRSENLMTVWLLASALAVWIWSTGRARLAGTGLLVFVAGLTEWPFLAAFVAIIGCAVVAAWIPGRTRGIAGAGLLELATISVAATAAVAVVVFWVNGTVPGDAVQRLPPAGRYRPFLLETLRTYAPLLTVPAVLAGWVAARRRGSSRLEAIRWFLGTWLLVTGLVVAVGILGLDLPTYRALTFALPVALATAAAPLLPASLALRSQPAHRPMWVALTAALAVAALLPGTLMWYRAFRPRTNPGELGQIAAVAEYAAAQPTGTTVVATYDDPDLLKALYYEGVFDAMLPAALGGRVQIFPGSAEAASNLTPRRAGDEAARDVIRDLLEDVRTPLAAGAPVVALRAFDPAGFSEGLVGSAPRIGDDVIVIRGPPPLQAPDARGPFLPQGWALTLWPLAMLLVLALAGLGWSGLALGSAPVAVRLAVAPAFGIAALAVLSLVASRAGMTLFGWAGPAIVGLSLAASLAAGRRTRRSAPAT